MPKATTPKRSMKVDWEKRDGELAVKIAEILASSNIHLSRTQLDQLLGGHGWLTKYKHCLPLSLNAYIRYKENINAGVKNATR
jgi:hypothetical protein